MNNIWICMETVMVAMTNDKKLILQKKINYMKKIKISSENNIHRFVGKCWRSGKFLSLKNAQWELKYREEKHSVGRLFKRAARWAVGRWPEYLLTCKWGLHLMTWDLEECLCFISLTTLQKRFGIVYAWTTHSLLLNPDFWSISCQLSPNHFLTIFFGYYYLSPPFLFFRHPPL